MAAEPLFGAEDVAEIERAIQLAIAPAFLLTGIFSVINVLIHQRADRPARPADRPGTGDPRWQLHRPAGGAAAAGAAGTLRAARISASALAAILLCSLIVGSFASVFVGLKVAWLLGALLIAAMLAMIVALSLFLTEVRLASHHLPLDNDA